MRTGFVISDLHLFARWSLAGKYMDRIQHAASSADLFVLNGDIFDFRWTSYPTTDDSVEAAVDWLRTLAGAHPRCRFHYIMGNHDGFRLFADRLDRLAAALPNLECHPSHVRLGRALFMHGDLLFKNGKGAAFERNLPDRLPRKNRFLAQCYNTLIALGAHGAVVNLFYGRKRCARRILHELQGPAHLRESLTDIYFGHTHVAFSEFKYGGYTFHNTGSTIRGLPSNMLEVPPSIIGDPEP